MEASLKPDSVKVDLNLAEEYLEKNEKLWICDDDTSANEEFTVIKVDVVKSEIPPVMLREKFLQLADIIQENALLFSQLEYMRRGIHPEDVISMDIKLLVQNLMFCSTIPKMKSHLIHYCNIDKLPKEIRWLREPLKIADDTPLAHVGFVTHRHNRLPWPAVIHTSQRSVPVCTLFAQLCERVGLDIELKIIKRPLENTVIVPENCTGVIAERSDIDSAVDAFLGSSTKYPWKFTRVLVQESVYERFANILDYKCKLKGESTPTALLQSCSKAFLYGDKTFLLDFFGEKNQFVHTNSGDDSNTFSSHFIYVEAYRTTKELMSLIKKYGSSYVSLWCSDISEANEIAYNIDIEARAIWINDYAIFNGPSVSSQVYYGVLKYTYGVSKLQEHILLAAGKWSKMTQETREKMLRKCIKIFAENETDKTSMLFIDEVQKIIFSDSHQKVAIEKGRMCVAQRLLVGMATLGVFCSDLDVLQNITEAISALRYGSGIIYLYSDHLIPVREVPERVNKLFKIMESENIPVMEEHDVFEHWPNVNCYKIKAVWTTFGTVFAN